MIRFTRAFGALLLALLVSANAALADESPSWSWYHVEDSGQVRLHLYVFWSNTCPHCLAAHRFLGEMQQRRPWLQVFAYETHNAANWDYYRRMAQSFRYSGAQVPAFFYCQHFEVGFESDEITGARLERALVKCYEAIVRQVEKNRSTPPAPPQEQTLALAVVALTQVDAPPPSGLDLPPDAVEESTTVAIPFVGETTAESLSLPMLTAILALCDSVNPCAFFVLLFLLSLMIHAHSRWRMLVVGGTFVFFSGFVYFLFMAAWLNLFMVLGHMRLITAIAGLLAVAAAVINVKDFFYFKRGVSLSIPEDVKPGIFQRMTSLIGATRFATMLAGTVVLATLVNLYELLCTSGFPMVYTRVLTLRDLPTATYYGYLVVYNVLYALPLAVIVAAFAWTLGTRKLSEYEGRVLKLLSGLMMLMLGAALVISPHLLNSLVGAAGLLGAAIACTAAIAWLYAKLGAPQVPNEIACSPQGMAKACGRSPELISTKH